MSVYKLFRCDYLVVFFDLHENKVGIVPLWTAGRTKQAIHMKTRHSNRHNLQLQYYII